MFLMTKFYPGKSTVKPRQLWLFAILCGVHAEIALDITAEICRGGEGEQVGNLDECQRLVTQHTGDVKSRVAVYPVICRIPADPF